MGRGESSSGESVDAYLAGLPRGLDSFPDCQAKGSVVRAYLAEKPVVPAPSYPPALRELLSRPPLAASWVPETHFLAVALAVREQHFTADDAFLRWVKSLNAALFRSAPYRVLMLVASPSMLALGAQRRWRQFHVGTDLMVTHDDETIDLTFRFPIRLFAPIHVRVFASAIEAAVEAAAGGECRTVSIATEPNVARVRLEYGKRLRSRDPA